jgi:hypothetical protein
MSWVEQLLVAFASFNASEKDHVGHLTELSSIIDWRRAFVNPLNH